MEESALLSERNLESERNRNIKDENIKRYGDKKLQISGGRSPRRKIGGGHLTARNRQTTKQILGSFKMGK